MKRYYLIERQGGGCDYTIGCGLRISKLDATTMSEAIVAAIGDINELLNDEEIIEDEDYLHDTIVDNFQLVHRYQDGDMYGVDEAEILEVTDSLDLDDIIHIAQKRLEDVKSQIAAKKKEAEDRKKYEELKKRFE